MIPRLLGRLGAFLLRLYHGGPPPCLRRYRHTWQTSGVLRSVFGGFYEIPYRQRRCVYCGRLEAFYYYGQSLREDDELREESDYEWELTEEGVDCDGPF